MELNIPVNGAERIYVMLGMFSIFPPYSRLDNREKKILSELYYINSELKQLNDHRRGQIIFDYDTRKEIAQKYGLSMNSVYNVFSSLKKKGFIEDNTLLHKLDYEESVLIQFKKNER